MSLFSRTLRSFSRVLLGVSLAGALISQPATAGVDRWTPFGPGGGTVAALVSDPSAQETLYALVEGEIIPISIFKSVDGGAFWRWSGDGLPDIWGSGSQALAIDPSHPWILYAAECASGVGHVFQSTNGAAHWSRVTPEEGVGTPRTSPGSSTCRLAVSPARPGALYLALDAALWRSLDRGATWILIGRAGNAIRSLLVDPASPSTLYVGAARAGGVYRYSHQEGTLTRIPGLRQGEALAASRSGRRLYVSSAGILYDSADHGATWRRRGSLGRTARALAVDAGAAGVIYAAHDLGASVSHDGGKTWKPALRGLPIVSFPGPAAPVAVLALAAHPFQPGRIFAGTRLTGVYETRDGGERWQAGDQLGLGRGTYRPPHVPPTRPDTVYVQALDNVGTLWRSTNGGRSWSRRSSAFGRGFFIQQMALDPISPQTLYASGTLVPGGQGLFKSLDGGTTWTGFGPQEAAWVTVTGRGVLLVSAPEGLWRSEDGGATGSFVLPRAGSLTPDPGDPDTVYLTRGERREDGVYMFLEQSRDGGLTWRTLLESPWYLSVAPAPGMLYAQAHTLLCSTDGGDSWLERTLPPAAGTGTLAVDPREPNTLLASGMGMGIFRSRDGGLTWKPFDRGLSVFGPFYFTQLGAHPVEPHTFFAAPFGAGLFVIQDSGARAVPVP